MKKIPRHTIKQVAEMKISETCDLESLIKLYPENWKDKLKELKRSRFTSVIYPK